MRYGVSQRYYSNIYGAEKAKKNIWHAKLCLVTSVTGLPVGYPDQKIYVPWVPKIAHTSLTPGHPTGRLPPHRTVTGQKDLCLRASASPKPHPSKPHPCNMPQAKTEVALQFSECCAAETALQHRLFCSAEVIWTRSCAAASEKLHCNIEKAALQESGAFLPLSCGFQAPTFRHPRLGPADQCLFLSYISSDTGPLRFQPETAKSWCGCLSPSPPPLLWLRLASIEFVWQYRVRIADFENPTDRP